MMRVAVSSHAVDRYIERVDRRASRQEALFGLGQIVALGRSRPLPRHWLRDHVAPAAGLTFLTWCQRPGICLLVRDGVVVTVITRAMCGPQTDHHLAAVRREPHRSAAETARWRWNGMLELDEAA
jgi:hypothetical protein